MAFNSIAFLGFFTLVAFAYWVIPFRHRSILLLAASYYFYASWRAEYLALLVGMTLLTYLAGRVLEVDRPERQRRVFFALSLLGSVGLLFGFKYLGFALQSLNAALDLLGLAVELPIPQILLPIGISFYTLQAVGYIIDVFRRVRSAERSFITLALFVAFFPQLVAGPIERSSRLLPQFHERQEFSPAAVSDGLKLMAWGFFKKLVIADRVALAVNKAYGDPSAFYAGSTLLFVTYLFAFQILCDFSAYTDIARGAARVLGFDLVPNFRRPYFATSVRGFWRRWHMSLTTWFRDYLYIPLGGSRAGTLRWLLNVSIVFLVSGLWHGAGLTFVVWGGLHAFLLIVGIATKPLRDRCARKIFGQRFRGIRRLLQMFVTFNLVSLAWIFFRADSVRDAWYVITHIFSDFRIGDLGVGLGIGGIYELGVALLGIAVVLGVNLVQERRSVLALVGALPQPIRWAIYYALLLAIFFLGEYGYEEFIYFQF